MLKYRHVQNHNKIFYMVNSKGVIETRSVKSSERYGSGQDGEVDKCCAYSLPGPYQNLQLNYRTINHHWESPKI